jgi:hypothetical protein
LPQIQLPVDFVLDWWGCSVMHVSEPLRVISLIDEILAKTVKDDAKLGPAGKLDKTVSAVDAARSNPR